jgi:hypothetical protein
MKAAAATGWRRSSTRLRNVLVIGEVSLACVLLVGAGLMLRSFLNQLQQNPGFETQHVFTASLALPQAAIQTTPRHPAVLRAGSQGSHRFPEYKAQALGSDLPWTGYDDNAGVQHRRQTTSAA